MTSEILIARQAEGGVGDLGVDQLLLRQHPEIDVALLGAGLLRHVEEVLLALDELLARGLRRGLVLEGDLLQTPSLRPVVGFLRIQIAGLDLVVGERHVLLELIDRQQEQRQLAVLGRHELRLVGLVGLLELGVVRLGDLDHFARLELHVLDRARLVAPRIERRRPSASAATIAPLSASVSCRLQLVFSAHGEEALLGETHLSQQPFETRCARTCRPARRNPDRGACPRRARRPRARASSSPHGP